MWISRGHTGPIRVLLAEDEALIAHDLKALVQEIGYEVAGHVTRGEDALPAVRNYSPDVVLMDIRLRGRLDGIDAAADIAREVGTPVVFLTAHSDRATFERARELNPAGYIVKPFSERDLRIAIELAVARSIADQQGRLLAAALERLPQAALVLDPDGRVVEGNRAVESVLGQKPEKVLGRSIRDIGLKPVPQLEEGSDSAETLASNGLADGKLELSLMRFGIGRHRDWSLLLVRNISEQLRNESEVLMAIEAEKARIGRDLHDGAGQVLTGALLALADVEPELRSDRVDRASELIREALGEIRAASRGLTAYEVIRNGLEDALAILASGVSRDAEVTCVFSAPQNGGPASDPAVEVHLYRIAQEAVSNALKHARPTFIDIRLRRTDSYLVLSVLSDGCRDDPDDWVPGVGLRSMRQRARVVGGELKLAWSQEELVTVECVVPELREVPNPVNPQER